MGPIHRIAGWLDIRPNEVRPALLCFGSAFFVIAFLVFSRSVREALYLTAFDVKTLPYITASIAILGLPTVALFVKFLAKHNASAVLKTLLVVMSVGLGLLWPMLGHSRVAVVLFYLWTSLGLLVITSGLWIVISEYFAIREAKRLYGFIAAGGTSGAMIIGTSLSWLTDQFTVINLIPGLIILLLFFLFCQLMLPASNQQKKRSSSKEGATIKESFGLVWNTNHLRIMMFVVMAATMASTLVDYQFKELVRASLTTKKELAGFFGAFYGWTGGISLFVQLVITSRLLAVSGVAVTLSVLPLILLLGSSVILLAPSLAIATFVRGADNSLRKSLHRSTLEFCYVPMPSMLRRKTKTFIDSVSDAIAEGIGAGLIFLWVTWGNLPSRYLSIFVAVITGFFLYQNRCMGRQYFKSLTERLKERSKSPKSSISQENLGDRDLLTMTLNITHFDLQKQLKDRGIELPEISSGGEQEEVQEESTDELDTLSRLKSTNPKVVTKALEECNDWSDEHLPYLVKFIANDVFYPKAASILESLGDQAVEQLVAALSSEATDFVIRRRIPSLLAKCGGEVADAALLEALNATRFEVRYRSAMALVKRRKSNLPQSKEDWQTKIYDAVRREVSKERPVWELQNLLDSHENDDFVLRRVGIRGELSLEHTFRMLTLVLDPELVRAAFHGTIFDDAKLKSYSLEYLEHVLPTDIKEKLWPFIGDISEYQKKKDQRSLDDVVSDLMKTGATLFRGDIEQAALKRILKKDS